MAQPRLDVARISAASEEREKLPSLCDGNHEEAIRRESWSKHFTIYEVLSTGEKVPIARSQPFVDAHSRFIIERTSESPEKIVSTDGVRDERNNGDDPLRFDIDVLVRRPRDGATCRIVVAVPDLQSTGPYDEAQMEPPGCAPNYRAYTHTLDIRKGEAFEIPSLSFEHGDIVEIQLDGAEMYEEETTRKPGENDVLMIDNVPIATTGKKVKYTAREWGIQNKNVEQRETSRDIAFLTRRMVCGRPHSVSFRVVDFSQIAPNEDDGKSLRPLLRVTQRIATTSDIYFDHLTGMGPPIASPSFRDAFAVTATAVGSDGKSRDVALSKTASRPTLEKLNHGETVVVRISRRLKSSVGTQLELPTRTFTFIAVATGLHSGISGERRAQWGTTSAFLAVLDNGGKYGFAQTFSYTATFKSRDPASIFEQLGGGVHVSVLARPEREADNEPLAFGVGVHAALGDNSVHLGGGYDVVNGRAYALIGVTLDDFASFIKAQ